VCRIAVLVHCAVDQEPGNDMFIILSSGMPLVAEDSTDNGLILLGSSDALDEVSVLLWFRQSELSVIKVRHPHLFTSSKTTRSGSFAILSSLAQDVPGILPITSIVSSLPRRGLALFAAQRTRNISATVPLSPIPAPVSTKLAAHCVTDLSLPHNVAAAKTEHLAFLPDLASGFVPGVVRAYTDSRGREAQTGTYDNLHRMLFSPPSSTSLARGGSLVDPATGTIVGVIGGVQPDFEGKPVGWGVPAEAVFEVRSFLLLISIFLKGSVDVRVAWFEGQEIMVRVGLSMSFFRFA
jgi:hypothetical protein